MDERAWGEFVEIYGPLIHRLARRRGLQDADAADLVQEVFRAVAGAIERYDPDPARGSFRGWLSTIARNLIVNLLDAQRRHPRGTGDTEVRRLLEEQPAPDSAAVRRLRRRVPPPAPRLGRRAGPRRVLRGDLAGLLEDRRRGPVGPRKRPEALGLSVGAVYQYKSRVVARLRREIERVGEWRSRGASRWSSDCTTATRTGCGPTWTTS